jgi:predicted enzyme involved in methoxymalonyl-ACP biosynthesis
MLIDTWLMSCRVLGRQVEQATLNLLAAKARRAEPQAAPGTSAAAARRMKPPPSTRSPS